MVTKMGIYKKLTAMMTMTRIWRENKTMVICEYHMILWVIKYVVCLYVIKCEWHTETLENVISLALQ